MSTEGSSPNGTKKITPEDFPKPPGYEKKPWDAQGNEPLSGKGKKTVTPEDFPMPPGHEQKPWDSQIIGTPKEEVQHGSKPPKTIANENSEARSKNPPKDATYNFCPAPATPEESSSSAGIPSSSTARKLSGSERGKEKEESSQGNDDGSEIMKGHKDDTESIREAKIEGLKKRIQEEIAKV